MTSIMKPFFPASDPVGPRDVLVRGLEGARREFARGGDLRALHLAHRIEKRLDAYDSGHGRAPPGPENSDAPIFVGSTHRQNFRSVSRQPDDAPRYSTGQDSAA